MTFFRNSETTLHVELTNRCMLKCPACPRTVWQHILKTPVKQADLNIDALYKFLDCPGGHVIDTLALCGDYGDPIYYPNLLEFIQRFRSTKRFTIVTNGSYRPAAFWEKLASLLTHQDKVVFSIDGLKENNHLYRVNSNWDSIQTGLNIINKSNAQLVWRTIVFKYNQYQLESIRHYAESVGAKFEVQKTHRFDNCEHLVPSDNAIESNHQYTVNFSSDDHVDINPMCVREKVITAEGLFFPCDFIRNPKTLFKSQLWKQKNRWIDRLNINLISYDQGIEIINNWAEFVKQTSIDDNKNVDVICKMKCRPGCQQDPKFEIAK